MSKKNESARKMSHLGIYYRVSTDKQELDSQKTAVDTWLNLLPEDKRPLSVETYEDEGISGKTTKRPEFQRLLKDAYDGSIDTIVCYRLDRFSRHTTTAIRLLLDLDEVGVAFISITQPVLNLGHENPFRRTMLAAFAEIAEIERETIVARVKAGLEAARKKGVRLGAPVKVSAEIYQAAFELRSQGLSYRLVGDKLGLSTSTIYSLLNSEIS